MPHSTIELKPARESRPGGPAPLIRVTVLILLSLTAAYGADDETARVLLVVNDSSRLSRDIGAYYARARNIPAAQICRIRTSTEEEITRTAFEKEIEAPIASLLRSRNWVDRIHYIVTTGGVPLKINGTLGFSGTAASVDSELAALYARLTSQPNGAAGSLPNPYFRSREPFSHPAYPMYLVTRLAGFTLADVRAMIDRSQRPRNRGIVVIDMLGGDFSDGELWLKQTANRLPSNRVALDETNEIVRGASSVIGYASWGSNDGSRRERDTGLKWLPGGLATEFVSTDGRTFTEPTAHWTPSASWINRAAFHAGSPQSLTADLIRQGATGASGHVYEPYLQFTPHPQYLFPAYLLDGRNLAESYYRAIPAISWMNIVVGDPLCRLGPR